MNNERFTEEKYEQALIELFQSLGYHYEYGYDMERDYLGSLLKVMRLTCNKGFAQAECLRRFMSR